MTTYLLSIYVTFEQEEVIRQLFKERKWIFRTKGLQPTIFEYQADVDGTASENSSFKVQRVSDGETESACVNLQDDSPSKTILSESQVEKSKADLMATGNSDLHENYHPDLDFMQSEEDQIESHEDGQLALDEPHESDENEVSHLTAAELKGCEENVRGHHGEINNSLGDLKNTFLPVMTEKSPLVPSDCGNVENNDARHEKSIKKHKKGKRNRNKDKNGRDVTELESSKICKQTKESCQVYESKTKSKRENSATKRKKIKIDLQIDDCPAVNASDDNNGEQNGGQSNTCTDCGTSFSNALSLKKHCRNDRCASGNNTCPICGKAYRKYERELLEVHLRQHKGELPYTCEVCGKMFAGKTYLNRHKMRHAQDASYFCDVCKMQFKQKELLRRHKKNMHGDRTKKFQCDICGNVFLYKGSLTQHYKSVHVTEKLFKCELCDRTFKAQHNLRIHKVMHSQESKDVCNVCGKTFKRRSAFNVHMKRHQNKRDYSCGTCGKLFYEGREVTEHMRIHSGEKPFKCTKCPYSCAIKGNLTKHMKVHDKEIMKTDSIEQAMKASRHSHLTRETTPPAQDCPGQRTPSVQVNHPLPNMVHDNCFGPSPYQMYKNKPETNLIDPYLIGRPIETDEQMMYRNDAYLDSMQFGNIVISGL